MSPLAAGLAGGAILLAGALATILLRRSRRALAAARDEAGTLAAELAIVHALGLELAAARDAERVFAIVDRECRKVVPADEVALGLLGHDPSAMTVRVRAAAERVPRTVGEPASRARTPSRTDRAIDVPLLGGGEVIGVLSLRAGRGRSLTDGDLRALVALSTPVALAAVALRRAHEAMLDPLTGFPRSDVIALRLAEELARARRHRSPVALVLVDIDRFRAINERQGFEAGDRFLAAAAETLRQHLRASDLAVRSGVDVFCVLLPATGLAGAEQLALRLRTAIAGLGATASFGVAAHPEHGATARTLLFRADAALHRAKSAGRDRVAIATV